MKVGASTLLDRDRPLNRDLLAAFQQAGIESVELTDYHPGFAYDDPAPFAALRGALEDLSLHLNSLHLHLEKFDPDFNLAARDAGQRERTLAAYRRAVDVMAALGGGILVTHDIRIPEPASASPGSGAEGSGQGVPKHEEARAAFLSNLDTIAHYAQPQGVRIALENTSRGYTREPTRLVGLMEELGAPNVGVCIDAGHRNVIGDPVEALRVVGRHLITLHIHDNHGERDEHLLPGRGSIAWKGVLQALREVAYGGVFMYELSRPEDLPAVRANFAMLRAQRDNVR